MADRISVTFGAYLTGGVPDGVPLWREPATGGSASEHGRSTAPSARSARSAPSERAPSDAPLEVDD